ncbi:Zn-ribbon domain-containing OB-fold protein [Rhodococcus wratislaviensis]|uniref:Zn-ribbon domain-containing OB-fold protein n=1 Tax=Rhodococcus wratislaviensis TaxID=44752 RepID=UPI003514AC8C
MTIPATRDDASAPYFGGLTRGRLMLRSCTRCGHVSRPDTISCPSCRSDDLRWIDSSGQGAVVTTIVDPTGPTVLALVELTEGPWIASRILRAETARDAPAGTPVCLAVLDTGRGEPIPAFVRAQ